MTNWHESPLMIVKSADPTALDGASLKKMLNEIEALLVDGYTLKSVTECNGEIFVFLLNESELGTGLVTKKQRTSKDASIEYPSKLNDTIS
jgi:DNA phosphorothioation-dependent restriction protein DptG